MQYRGIMLTRVVLGLKLSLCQPNQPCCHTCLMTHIGVWLNSMIPKDGLKLLSALHRLKYLSPSSSPCSELYVDAKVTP